MSGVFAAINWGTPIATPRTWVHAPVSRLPIPADYLKTGGGEVTYQTQIWKTRTQRKTAMALKVKKFKELVEGGTPMKQAAAQVHETVVTLQKRTKEDFGREVQDTLDAYGWLPPDIKREYTRARLMEIQDMAMTAAKADPADPKMLKVALDATRAVADDKDIGIYQAPKIGAINPEQTTPINPALLALISGVEEKK